MGLVCGVSLDQEALVHHLQDEYDDGDEDLREFRRKAVAGEPTFTDSLEVVEDPVEGRYMVSLPWKGQERPKRNFGQACARAKALERTLTDDQNIKVQEELDNMLQKGWIKAIDPQKVRHFAPLRPVFRDTSTTTSTRVTVDGREINQYLRVGSVDGQLLISEILMAWRAQPHVINLDLTRAFNAVKLHPSAGEWLAFVAYGATYTWSRLPFGLCCSPAGLFQCIHIALDGLLKEDRRNISIYVDDISIRGSTILTTKRREKEVIQRLKSKGFDFQQQKRVSSITDQDQVKNLGYIWDVGADTVIQRLPNMDVNQRSITKRQAVGYYCRWYDALGIFSNVSIAARLNASKIFQEVKCWEDNISEQHAVDLQKWYQQVQSQQWCIPRCVSTKKLMVFADASISAWASEIFGEPYGSTDKQASLVKYLGSAGVFSAASTRWSVPKKELYALFKAVQLVEKVRSANKKVDLGLPTAEENTEEWPGFVFFVDSAITVWRLRRSKSTAIRKRLSKTETSWLDYIVEVCVRLNAEVIHIASEQNLADGASRGRLEGSVSITMEQVQIWRSGGTLVSYKPATTVEGDKTTFDYDELLGLACSIDELTTGDEEVELLRPDHPFGGALAFRQEVEDHQRRSVYITALRCLLEKKPLPSGCPIPSEVLKRQLPLYEVRDGIVLRTVRNSTEGDIIKQALLDPSSGSILINKIIDNVHLRSGHLGRDKLSQVGGFSYFDMQ
ncbi:hypothetical protein Pmar_PMAR015039 [Perkinsus marinus ATCC 50983]|uniref:Reverse transcriptase domain-containing protein n=1 Tax=Perkinsus marinus (strain ATCC 50983 / TXsc) TaxID=423536 RepID=C5KRL1_PERM5|nr:hypothetical protein Pmar_PMAR015039 [Perkinsus marinus ATCC 50983]EER12873.1 hypothetical protein Pmar_PMAR015039 [Perkinsus marinus ATCC 50983]|eukprot:XP_002781078.1 hypothetical protein Pmar_PMAR015039 [Perkinsus marinus ATCC 50983]